MKINPDKAVYLLEKFKPLIHKTLQRLNIRQTHMNYDDYYQELQIHLLKILHTFKNKAPNEEEELYLFTGYAGRCLYFHGINLLRKKSFNSLDTTSDENIEWVVQEKDSIFTIDASTLYIKEFLNLAEERLSSNDYSFLVYLVEGKYNMQEIADKFGVSRSVMYERKSQIQKKLRGIKKCLKD